ncbi:tautomerase family protein [Bauldia litoralis]|uniref:4-oxalocrotonate tautomerase n=1 Tax=Bauldia litoralis TaxID=665467 RepID=A0A1G6DFE8_9HYPH|nr:tautomerase family protein [Bauldia litoralis]SDB43839.1 4-oxalocrotonate tautomerase [Bauldia litoralis]
MPMVKITYVAENLGDDAEARKTAVAGKVSQAIAEEMGVNASAVWVVFEDVGAKDWFVGPESVKEMRAKSS